VMTAEAASEMMSLRMTSSYVLCGVVARTMGRAGHPSLR